MTLGRVAAAAVATLALAATAAPATAAPDSDATRQAKGPQSRVITLGLRRDGEGLAQFANQASNPGTPTYREFLELGQLKDRFGAAPKARKRAKRFLRRAAGVAKVELSSTGAVLLATMSEGASKRLFCAKGADPPKKGLCVPGKLGNAVRQVVAGELFSKKASRGTPRPPPALRAARRRAAPMRWRAAPSPRTRSRPPTAPTSSPRAACGVRA